MLKLPETNYFLLDKKEGYWPLSVSHGNCLSLQVVHVSIKLGNPTFTYVELYHKAILDEKSTSIGPSEETSRATKISSRFSL